MDCDEMKSIIEKIALCKEGTFEEFKCAICGSETNLHRPPKTQGYLPTFCKQHLREYAEFPQKKFSVTFCRKEFHLDDILAPNFESAIIIAKGQIESDLIIPNLLEESLDWYIEEIKEVKNED